jgi:hypothetical protein
MSAMQRKCQLLSKLQIRKLDEKEIVLPGGEEEEIIENEKLCAVMTRYETIYKPPHRYRTCVEN